MSNQSNRRRISQGQVPVSGLSIFDPIFLGLDENGYHVSIELAYHNLLIAGEPGAGSATASSSRVARKRRT